MGQLNSGRYQTKLTPVPQQQMHGIVQNKVMRTRLFGIQLLVAMYALSYFEKLLSSSSDGYVNLYDINESEGGVLRQQYKEKDCTYFNIQLIQPVCSG